MYRPIGQGCRLGKLLNDWRLILPPNLKIRRPAKLLFIDMVVFCQEEESTTNTIDSFVFVWRLKQLKLLQSLIQQETQSIKNPNNSELSAYCPIEQGLR